MERVMIMEMETSRTCLDPILQMLEELPRKIFPPPLDPASPGSEVPPSALFELMDSINTMRLDLTLFKMFFWGLSHWEDLEFDWHLRFTFLTTVSQLSEAARQFVADCGRLDHRRQELNWEELGYDLEAKIVQFKPQVEEICILFLRGTGRCKPCQQNQWKPFLDYGREIACFTDFIQRCLKDLLFGCSMVRVTTPEMRQQIEFILKKLEEFGNFSYPVSVNHLIVRVRSFSELMFRRRTWVNQISCLACLYWIHGMDESAELAMMDIINEVMSKTFCHIPGAVASCLDSRAIPQLLASYTDFLLRGLVIPVDSIEKLQQGLIFLLSFLVHPPEEDSKNKEVVLAQIYDMLIKKLPFLKAYKLSSFLKKIDGVKVEVGDMYFMTPHSSYVNSPRTNAIGFLDSLLGTLKKLLEAKVNFVPLTKSLVEAAGVALASLRPLLQSNTELQSEQWDRILEVVYYAGYVIDLCSTKVVPVWYCILALPSVLKEIDFIKNQIKKIEDQQICCMNRSLGGEMKSSISLTQEATNPNIEGDFTGFEEDVESIMNNLLRGQKKDLTIISVSGMPGQGKTTLAKRIYNDPLVQRWFQTAVWIFVSKECTKRELLIKVAKNVAAMNRMTNDDILKKQDHDLVELVWRSLRQRRYLIVLDDVWEVGLWCQVERSFPNDKVGSRIMFTSRNHDLASQANPSAISHRLPLFSDEESWELMRKKFSHCHGFFPAELSEIGKQIAICCKGLPLAVSLIAAVLAGIEPNMIVWEQLAKDLKSRLASEGCRNVIELSYDNLPDHLKACFLYTGTFPRGANILARKLKLLWIAEGFIKDGEMEFSEDLADVYLGILVSQSLVVVTERTSIGKIKKCNVHDLLYDFCLEKAVEESFLHWAEESSVIGWCNAPSPQKFNHRRLCIGKSDTLFKPRPTLTREELPTSQVHSFLWFSLLGEHSFIELLNDLVFFLESFKVLTILDCEGVLLGDSKTFEAMLSNIHLKYIALKLCGNMSLPPSLTNLWNLETLIVNCESVVSLPVSMWTMKSLRHVLVKYWRLSSEDCTQVCDSFAAYSLESLGVVFLGYDSQIEEFLAKFTRLRKLGVYVDGGSEGLDSKWFSIFRSLKGVESLQIQGIHMKISTLCFPEIKNLKKLSLSGIQLPWCLISEIGKKLPNLEVLKLLMYACCGTSWDLEDGESFPKLRYLKLESLDFAEINFPVSDDDEDDCIPFPCLEVLIVNSCDRLMEIPSSFGSIYTLNTIKVIGFCTREARLSAKRILEEQRELSNDVLQVIVEHDEDVKEGEVSHEHDSA